MTRSRKTRSHSRRPGARRALAEALEPRYLLSALPTVTLSIAAANGSWTAYASDSASNNLGLSAYGIDVTGSSGVSVTSSFANAPKAAQAGFDYLDSNGNDGIDVTAAQSVIQGPFGNVFPGVGQTAGSQDGASWASPVQIATGTYSGTSGTLSVNVATNEGAFIESLKDSGNGTWTGPGNVYIDSVIGGSVTVTPPPPFILTSGQIPAGATDLASTLNGDAVTYSGSPVQLQLSSPATSGYFSYSGIPTGYQTNILLQFTDTATSNDPVSGSVLLDVENYVNSNDGGIANLATAGSTINSTPYDLALSDIAGPNDPIAAFDFSSFTDSAVPAGDLAVTAVAVTGVQPLSVISSASLTTTAGISINNVQFAAFADADGPQSAAAYSASINWGDGTGSSSGTISVVGSQVDVSGSHDYATNGSYHPTITLTDSVGTASAIGTVTASNPLSASAVSFSTTQGRTFSGAITNVTDANVSETSSQLQATITWGDGTATAAVISGSSGAFVVSGTHTYLVAGSVSPTVSISDAATNSATSGQTITVASAQLSVDTSFGSSAIAGVPLSVAGLVAFKDAGGLQSASAYSATINWGDGTSTATGGINLLYGDVYVGGAHNYTLNGTYEATVTLSDLASSVTTTAAVVVANPLTMTLASVTPSGEVPFTGTVATVTDANPMETASQLAASITWGDGSITSGTVTGSNGQFSIGGTHTYQNVGTYSFSVSITDNATNSTSAARQVNVIGGSLSPVSAATLSATAGVALNNVTLATFSDSGGIKSASTYSATVNWGDGTSSTPGAISIASGQIVVTGTHDYATNGAYQPSITLGDSFAFAVANASATVANPLSLMASLIAPTQGRSFSGTVAQFTDANAAETAGQFSASVTWGDGTVSAANVSGANGIFAVSAAHTYLITGSTTLSISVTDAATNTATTNENVSIAGAALTARSASSLTATAGVALSNATLAKFDDAGGVQSTAAYVATINWGDNTSNTTGTVSVVSGHLNVTGSHVFPTNGVYQPTITLSDLVSSATATATATVANSLQLNLSPVTPVQNQAFTGVVASLADANLSDTTGNLTATINWGDNSTTSGILNGAGGAFTISGTHTYATAGSFTLIANTQDGNGNTATAQETVVVPPVNTDVATQLVFVEQPTNLTAGNSFTSPIVVYAEDGSGNVVTNYNAAVTLGMNVIPTNASFTPISVTAVNGVATFSGVAVFDVAGGYKLSAAQGSLTAGKSSKFFVLAAPATQLVFATQPTNVTAGNTFASNIVVQAEDPFGNVDSTDNSALTLSMNVIPTGVTFNPITQNFAGGVASIAVPALDVAGGYKFNAAQTNLPAAKSSKFYVLPAAATQLVFAATLPNVTAGSTFASPVQIDAEDQFGNVDTNFTSAVTLSLSVLPTGLAFSPITENALLGVANFNVPVFALVGSYKFTATANGLTSAKSSKFYVTTAG